MQNNTDSQHCKQCREVLFDFVSDCTNEKQSVFVRNHLDSCEACRAEYQEICAMLSVLREDSVPELPKGFRLSLHQKLVNAAEEIKQKKERSFFGVLKKMGSSAPWKAVAPAMVCFVLVIAAYSGGVFEQWQQSGKPLEYEDAPVVQVEETPVPTAETTAEPVATPIVKKETPVQKTTATSEPVAETSVPAATEEPVADMTENGVNTTAEASATEENHVPMMMSYHRTPGTATELNYSLSVSGLVADFLDACRTATDLTLEPVSEDAENHAILHLSEDQWKIFSQYIENAGQELVCITPEESGAVVVVEINGYEG
ncbi:MAG: zf-HC2 domain-containing protein [Clostridia bacterium]|nr:zf-HC2 domain-containing protein [Clostridia bacterium]